MSLQKLFIKSKNEYSRTLGMISNVFHIDYRLPEQVFQESFDDYMFEEFDWVMSSESWSILQTLTQKTNDDNIIVAVLDPKPVDYYYKKFGYYNWGNLPIDLTKEDYVEFLRMSPKDSIADSILYNSNIILWTSPSLKWGIFGERDYGSCILALNKNLNTPLTFLKSWHTVEEALESWIPNSFYNQKIPKNFANILCNNYRKEEK
ncbi:hypothetical protein DCCM_0499 [Desulfocucumis palustris]|uniref:Uncharacterized protein n=1 Tax=Desulfocucumis palustris TaxID=1898651 RepID=A0A2L2X810_9FIRM|nr:hypothetical protein [Desulfocucumis palustris]GBF32305.1 hypothetical protein DCCM_0499 [Desulfocucumis palustris]